MRRPSSGMTVVFRRLAYLSLRFQSQLKTVIKRSNAMGKKDPRVDAYIAKSEDFAKPILAHLRKLVHTACPEVEETMKWSFPHFDYKGMLCSMASFKEHCAFGFWKEQLILGTRPGSDRKSTR